MLSFELYKSHFKFDFTFSSLSLSLSNLNFFLRSLVTPIKWRYVFVIKVWLLFLCDFFFGKCEKVRCRTLFPHTFHFGVLFDHFFSHWRVFHEFDIVLFVELFSSQQIFLHTALSAYNMVEWKGKHICDNLMSSGVCNWFLKIFTVFGISIAVRLCFIFICLRFRLFCITNFRKQFMIFFHFFIASILKFVFVYWNKT